VLMPCVDEGTQGWPAFIHIPGSVQLSQSAVCYAIPIIKTTYLPRYLGRQVATLTRSRAASDVAGAHIPDLGTSHPTNEDGRLPFILPVGPA